MIYIDSKSSGFKSYLSENRLSNGGVKTSIDQSAVAPSEQNNVDLELKDSTKNTQDQYSQKKEKHEQDAHEEQEEKSEKIVATDAEVKSRNMKLLNLL